MNKALLSIDIGYKNLGYTLFEMKNDASNESNEQNELDILIDLESNEQTTKTFNKLTDYTPHFGIFNITEHSHSSNVVESRCKAIDDFFEFIVKRYQLVRVVIEKQVPTNTIAMCLMYAIYTKALQYCDVDNIVVFDPKVKFTSINEEYNTKNKE